MMIGPEKQVVQRSPCKVKIGSNAASRAANITGMYSGLQPAMTELMATFSIVHSVRLGGMRPTTSLGFRRVPESIRMILSPVGGTMGKPSLHPRSKACSIGSSNSPISIVLELRGRSPKRASRVSLTPGITVREPHPGLDSGRCSPNMESLRSWLHSLRTQPTEREVSCPFSNRIRVGTVSILSL